MGSGVGARARMARALAAISITAVGAVLAIGCANDGSAPVAEAQVPAHTERVGDASHAAQSRVANAANREPRKRARKTLVKLKESDYGPVLFDDKGGALYLFTADPAGKSSCYGDCARAWPPFFARGKLRARGGADQDLLGRTERRDGRKQVTYAGQPLYYYVADLPNEILCHDVFEFGGDWLVVQGSGQPAP